MNFAQRFSLGVVTTRILISLLIFTIGVPYPNQTTLSSNADHLAPVSVIQSFQKMIHWLKFARTNSTASVIPTEEVIREEIKQLGRTLVLEESGEDRILYEDLGDADLSPIEGDLFVISDVHLSPKENLGLPEWKHQQFLDFLDKIAEENGNLVINGDFIEGHMPRTLLLKSLKEVYSRLRKIKRVFYLAGNHDAEFEVFNGKRWQNISFVDTLSIRQNGKIVHIEHGHYTDWWWHHIGENIPLYKKPFMFFGKGVIRTVNWLGKTHNVDVSMGWVKWANWIKFFLFVPMLFQLLLMDIRIRHLRREMDLTETAVPFISRLFKPVRWIYNLHRLWWELHTPKHETILQMVIGHYHYGDMFFMSLFQRILEATETRVKIHFTAGRWVPLPVKMRLKFTRIQSDGTVEDEYVNEFIGEASVEAEGYAKTRRFKPWPLFSQSLASSL